MSLQNYRQIDAAVIVPIYGEAVLMSMWKQGPCQGMWGCPGGKVESHEILLNAALREAREEAGLIVPFQSLVNIGGYNYAGVHATVFVWPLEEKSEYTQNLEPEKLSEWEWVNVRDPQRKVHPAYHNFVFPILVDCL